MRAKICNFVGLKGYFEMDELREIIYRERKDLESFFRENQLWEDLYDDYYIEVQAELMQKNPWMTSDAQTVFNDAYYYCHLVQVDMHPEYKFRNKFFHSMEFQTDDHYERATAVAYIILSLSNRYKAKSVQRFLKTADCLLRKHHYFKAAKDFVDNNRNKYNYSIELTPISPEELEKKYGQELSKFWYNFIESIYMPSDIFYQSISLEQIIQLYKSKEHKLKIIDQMTKGASEIWNPNHEFIQDKLRTEIENMADAVTESVPTSTPTPTTPGVNNTATPATVMSNTGAQPVNDAVNDSTPPKIQDNIPLLPFKEEGGLDKWASLVKEAVKDIEDHTLNSRLDNTMFAVMFYFSSGWMKRKGIFKKAPKTTALVHFFLYRCDFNPEKVKPKTLVNKLNDLFKGAKDIENTDEIERVKKKIQNIITKNS